MTDAWRSEAKDIREVSKALSELGLEDGADLLTKASAILQTVSGTLAVAEGAVAAISVWNGIQSARAVMSAGAAAANPLLWPNLALAIGTAAVTAGAVAAITKSTTIKADLSTPEGRSAAISGTMQAIA